MSVIKTRSVRPATAETWPTRLSRRGILITTVSLLILLAFVVALWMATRFDPLGRSHAAFDRRDYRSALGASEEYLKRWTGNPRASLLAARCATRMGQPSRAEGHFANAGSLDFPDLHDRAYGMVLTQQPRRAVELYGLLLDRQPDDALALKRLAAVLMGLKRYARLPEIAERLMSLPGEEVAGRTLAGIACHVDRRYPEAADAFLKVLEIDPDLKSMPLPVPLFWNHLAIDLLAQGKFAEARNYLMKGLVDSQDAGLVELLGATYQQEGRADEAEHCWRLAVERDPNQLDALLDLGQLAITRRHPQEAITLLTKAAELSPDSIEAHQNLSVAYRLLGETDEAERFSKVTADLRARNPQAVGQGQDRASALQNAATGSIR